MNKLIMYLEDDEMLREGIVFGFMETNYDIVDFPDGYEAIKYLENEENKKPDIYITDISMPSMDGITFIKELHKRDIHKPIIVISGYSNEDYKEELESLGVAKIILKGDSEELIESVDLLISHLEA